VGAARVQSRQNLNLWQSGHEIAQESSEIVPLGAPFHLPLYLRSCRFTRLAICCLIKAQYSIVVDGFRTRHPIASSTSAKCATISAIDHFSVRGRRILRLLESVLPVWWVECYGVHEVRGRHPVEEFARLEAAHDLNHLRQIDRILVGGM
jgi:hypothetical protein